MGYTVGETDAVGTVTSYVDVFPLIRMLVTPTWLSTFRVVRT